MARGISDATTAGRGVDNFAGLRKKERTSQRGLRADRERGLGLKLAGCGLVSLCLMLGGCAAIPGFGPPPVDAYDLAAPVSPVAGRRLSRTQILVPEPSALKLLDGQDIAIRQPDGALQLLGGARWSDRLPRLVQEELVKAYHRSGRLGGVGTPGEGLAVDYQVIVDIHAFEVRPTAALAHVELFVRVLDDRTGVVRASRDFVTDARIVGNGGQAFVAALDQAFKAAVADIVDWSIGVM